MRSRTGLNIVENNLKKDLLPLCTFRKREREERRRVRCREREREREIERERKRKRKREGSVEER